MAKTTSTALARYAPAGNVSERLAALAKVEYIEPQSLMSDVPAPTEERTLELLEKEGFPDPQAAWSALFGTFGMRLFADKDQLAQDGTNFKMQRIVMRRGGGFSKQDDWAIEIVTDLGELLVLTFERNDGRDSMLFYAAAILHRYGEERSPWVHLERIDKSDGTHFHLIVPRGSKADAIDAQFRDTT